MEHGLPFPSILDEVEEGLEQEHFDAVLCNLRQYTYYAMKRWKKLEQDYGDLDSNQKDIIPTYHQRLIGMIPRIHHNQLFLNRLAGPHAQENDPNAMPSASMAHVNPRDTCGHKHKDLALDVDHVRSTLRQFVRDWSKEGELERAACYGTILNALDDLFKDIPVADRHAIHVLNPGAGLGRLPFEIIRKGFSCQGNEFSLYMLLASEFMLNRTCHAHQETLYPYVLQTCNMVAAMDALQAITVPDICPSEEGTISDKIDFSMVAGDFLQVYHQEETWDVIVTCFFIDTANNVLDYLQQIYHILKKGGIWINLGPLLYHYEGSDHESSIELTLEEIKHVVKKLGFSVQVDDE